jgi:hypothetical protein
MVIPVKKEVETEDMISDAMALKKALKFFDAQFFDDSKVIVHHILFISDLSMYPVVTFRDNIQMFLKPSS